MVSTSTKFALNEKALDKKAVSTHPKKASIKDPFRLAEKTAFIVRN